jgi:hypothetical protein
MVYTFALYLLSPKTSEATVRGNIVSTDCFLGVLTLASVGSSAICGAMVPDAIVRYIAENEPWLYKPISA